MWGDLGRRGVCGSTMSISYSKYKLNGLEMSTRGK